MYRLHLEMEVPIDRDTVFAFFADAANLGRITPPELHFSIHTSVPIRMTAGTLIDYTIRLWGIPLRWHTRITAWDPPARFVDEQLSGPYKTWIHTHHFRSVANGTVIEDEVVYALPLGPLGRVAAPLVRRQLRRIFSYREARVRELLTR